jgi:hypothetical protein
MAFTSLRAVCQRGKEEKKGEKEGEREKDVVNHGAGEDGPFAKKRWRKCAQQKGVCCKNKTWVVVVGWLLLVRERGTYLVSLIFSGTNKDQEQKRAER